MQWKEKIAADHSKIYKKARHDFKEQILILQFPDNTEVEKVQMSTGISEQPLLNTQKKKDTNKKLGNSLHKETLLLSLITTKGWFML